MSNPDDGRLEALRPSKRGADASSLIERDLLPISTAVSRRCATSITASDGFMAANATIAPVICLSDRLLER